MRLARSKSRPDAAAVVSLGRNKSKETRGRTTSTSPYKASFDDLRSPDGRQKLREQLSSAFPESYAESLTTSPSIASMAGREYLQAASSSSSLDSTANGPKRLSALPEQGMQAIDVEQAIHLLTELKKTATPEQLVALHKALLPTRDSIVSTADSAAGCGKRASMIRQKSMLPPGLATRGGANDDLLRRQEDLEPTTKRDTGRAEGHRRVQSEDRLAALDLAFDDAAGGPPAKRTPTPNDDHYFGGFRPGTLRITNGAASPEPSLRPKPSVEGIIPVSDEHVMIGRARAESLAKAGADTQAEREPLDEEPEKRVPTMPTELQPEQAHPEAKEATLPRSRQSSQTRSAGPSPATSRDPSRTRQPRPRPSLDLHQSGMSSITPRARSRDPSSRTPGYIDAKQIKTALAGSRKSSVDTLFRRSVESFTIRRSIDDGRVSPLDVPPRFAQRWSHRASQISQEYTTDCDVPLSPFADDRQHAMTFEQRLSTVFGEDAEDTTTETPEAALSKLEGNTAIAEDETGKRRSSLKATAEKLNIAMRPVLMKRHSAPRAVPSKADSGYVSDASHQSLQRGTSYDTDTRHSVSSITHEQERAEAQAAISSWASKADETPAHMASSMPSQPSESTTPSRPDASRKHSSLLRLPALMKSTVGGSRTTIDLHDTPMSSPQNETPGSSPADTKTTKAFKKLQKRMPEEVRKQRRAQREKEKQKQMTLALSEQYGSGIEFNLVSSPLPMSEPPTPMTHTAPTSPFAVQNASMPIELAGDAPQPTEPETDESAPAPKSQDKERKSRRRSRASTIIAAATGTGTDTEDADDQKQRRRSFSLGGKRSKSKMRSGSMTPKRKSQEVPAVPNIAALSAMWSEDGTHDEIPMHSDHRSISRTLGTNPYDISTAMFKQGNSSQPELDGLQSPHQISTSFSRSENGGLRGMDSAMASELARRKSRDVAYQNNEDLYDRPRMATPRKRSQTDIPRGRNAMPNAVMVQQRSRSPGWNEKPIFRQGSFESLGIAQQERPHSVADSIPSLPELPADAEARSAKATEYLAKYRNGMQTSPVLASSPSPQPSPNAKSAEQAGFSSESVAEAVAKAVQARRLKRAELIKQGQKADRLRPLGPRMDSDSSSSTSRVSLQLRASPERPNSDASASIMIGVGSDRDVGEGRPGTASTPAPAQQDADEPSVWDRQAELWRQKRESLGQTLSTPVQSDFNVDGMPMVTSPSTIVSPQSFVSARDTLPSARRREETASHHADAYRDLIGDDRASFCPTPDPHRASVQSATTITSRSTPNLIGAEDTLPTRAYDTPIARVRSPGGRVRTPSGSYHPYMPAHAAQAERSRASLVQIHNKASRSTQSLDIQRRPHNVETDTLESIVGRYDRALSPVPASEAGSIDRIIENKGRSPEQQRRAAPMTDRYGGGLQYGYEKGVGLQGSSGMRSSMHAKIPRGGGNQFSEHFGLDLGDVPMFLSRAS